MGFLHTSTNDSEIFDNLENILNKSILSLINNDLEKNNEYKNNYNFICSLIDYYQSLKNNLNINKKYSYYIISSKTKNISSFIKLNKAKQIYLNWIKLLCKAKAQNNYILDNKELQINLIKSQIIHNIKQNKLFNIFKENFLNYYNSINNKCFIKLILSGLPGFLRPIIWKIILESNTKIKDRPSLEQCLNLNCNPDILKQICKDINRTFVINNEDNFSTIEKIDDEKINKLKNILIAISNYNSDIGYTQGMNNIIGFILKITNFDEAKAFDLSILILEKIKGYYINDFPMLKRNLSTFNVELNKRNHKLYNHCMKNDIPDELWISKWIQTLFTINFSFNEVCRIWDALIIFGFDFIVYISLAIVDYAEDELVKLDDSSDFVNYLKELMNPVPGVKKYITNYLNYKDFVIPVYFIISKAKKIKREVMLDSFYFNNFKSKFFNNDIKENKNYFSNFHINNSSNSELISNLSYDIVKKNENLVSLKSYSPDKIIYKNNNILSSLNQSQTEKKEKNKNDTFKFNRVRNDSGISGLRINLFSKDNYNRLNKDNNASKNNNLYQQSNNNMIRNKSDINNVNIYLDKQKSNNALRKNNDLSDCIIKNDNHYYTHNIILNNFYKNGNYYYSGFNNINKNKSNNYVNGKPRRNMKILVHKKINSLVNPFSNIQLSKTRNGYISKSPDYAIINTNSNIKNSNNNIINNNIGCRYDVQNNIYKNNKFFVNMQRRGSYNTSFPVKYIYNNSQNISKIII